MELKNGKEGNIKIEYFSGRKYTEEEWDSTKMWCPKCPKNPILIKRSDDAMKYGTSLNEVWSYCPKHQGNND